MVTTGTDHDDGESGRGAAAPTRPAGALAATLRAAAFLGLLGVVPATTPTAAAAEARTLERGPDRVLLEAREAPGLLGKKLGSLGALALRDGAWQPVPFQIDERTPTGEYVFSGGKEANPGDGNGLVDPQDELCFMARDAGDRATDEAPPAGATGAVELELTDPITGAKGWLYLWRFEGAAPRSDVDYVRYDPGADHVDTDLYGMYYNAEEDQIFFSDLVVPEAAGGTGRDFADRLKLRTYVKTKLFFSLSFDEEEWESVVTAYLDGPIRVIRLIKNRLTFLGFEVAPTVQVHANYFRDFHFAPAEINQTLNLPSVANEAWFKFSIDLNEHAEGMRYYRPSPGVDDPWHPIDGVPEERDAGMDPREPDWHLVTGAPGTLMWWVEMPPPLVPVTDLFFRDDVEEEDDPDPTEGLRGEIGYRFDLFPLDVGKYRMRIFYMFPERWEPGDEQGYLDMIREPLEVSAHTR